MYNILKHAHSGWAYLVVIVLVIATINVLISLSRKREFGNKDFSLALLTLIATHIQLLLGIVLYFLSPYFQGWSEGMGEVMGNSQLRLFLVEHPVVMILATTLITIGYSKHKKQRTSHGKFKKLSVFYTIGLILVLTRLPWSQWFNWAM